MERASLLRWLLIGAAVFLFLQFGLPMFTGKTDERQPLNLVVDEAPPEAERKQEQLCTIEGNRFRAELSSRGGVLKHAWMLDAKYHYLEEQVHGAGTHQKGEPIDLVSTSRDAYMPLRTNFRFPYLKDGSTRTALDNAEQVRYDDFDWELAASDGKSCTFTYQDERVALKKTISVNDRPFELELAVEVTNKAAEPQRHRLTVQQSDWRTDKETSGSFGRTAELHTRTEARTGDETHHSEPGDFDPGDFSDDDFTREKWRAAPGAADWVAVTSSYFTKALFPLAAPAAPAGEQLIEHVWEGDKHTSNIYLARLAYPAQELAPGESASYSVAAYVGPKERQVLSAAIGGDHKAVELLDLGFFGWIGKLLIQYLYLLHDFTRSWGWAICLLTITVKFLLFPLSISQIKSSMAMRRLKPQMDELNQKYKDDATQRGLALQELWRKNNVTNPMLGCLPVLLQMPVWFALYTALQTAVELYHTPFGPIIPDLSAPGRFYIIPIVLGLSSLLQQHLMPMQGDPMQQKMMKWMMPAMFTVFMLFLPAGLGIYFLTNTWLGIGQQLAVERYYKSQEGKGDKDAPVPDKPTDDKKGTRGAKGAKRDRLSNRGEERVEQRG
jgi:YidC/Oxa1 family membrane protein insertase